MFDIYTITYITNLYKIITYKTIVSPLKKNIPSFNGKQLIDCEYFISSNGGVISIENSSYTLIDIYYLYLYPCIYVIIY